ncbi:MAG: RibD family protein [Rhodobacteraceae bacterium]|nr:RibD family protein [Paracoccaceae bacterium]
MVAQLGLSLDGRIATETGDAKYINGTDALAHLHRIRALVDAVVVGAGTVRADDPQLTVRHCPGRHPARVVIDPNGTIGARARVWTDDGARLLVFGGAPHLPARVERIPVPRGDIPTPQILSQLARRGLRRLLIEGGADTLSRFLAADAVDYLHLLYGRVIIGSGKVGINLPAAGALANAPRPATRTHIFPDGDLLVSCDFRDR